MNISEYIAGWLESKNLSTVYCVSGGGIIFLQEAISRNANLNLIYNHHEQASVMAAEGHARISGLPGVCLLTVGPGATNGLTGLLGAWMDSVPLLVFSGQSFKEQTILKSKKRQVGIQEVDILTMVKSVTKSRFQLDSDKSIRDQLDKSFENSIQGRSGPVWIEVTVDVQKKFLE
jgi:acetolactate synthase-1/2/3 large subunit